MLGIILSKYALYFFLMHVLHKQAKYINEKSTPLLASAFVTLFYFWIKHLEPIFKIAIGKLIQMSFY